MSEKICRSCGLAKGEFGFRGNTDLCRDCSTKAARTARLANRDDRPHGQYSGDVCICPTCKKEFTVTRTVKYTRVFCSVACMRPTKDIVKLGLAAIQKLPVSVKLRRIEKAAATLTGRAAHGRAAKGTRNHKAKFYELIGPGNILYEFKNLRHFIRTNPQLFTEDELRTYSNRSSNSVTTYAELALRSLFSLNKDGELKKTEWHGWMIGDKSSKSLKKLKRSRSASGQYV